MKNLTLEETKSLHKEMWEYIDKNYEGEYRIFLSCNFYKPSRIKLINILKIQFLQKLKMEGVKNHCFLCEYARQQSKLNEDRGNMCKYCPAIWGTEDECEGYFCESYSWDGNLDYINWIESKPSEIANIQFKE